MGVAGLPDALDTTVVVQGRHIKSAVIGHFSEGVTGSLRLPVRSRMLTAV